MSIVAAAVRFPCPTSTRWCLRNITLFQESHISCFFGGSRESECLLISWFLVGWFRGVGGRQFLILNLQKSLKINEHLWNLLKSMNIYGMYWLRGKKMGYSLYSNNINASHICPPKKEIDCVNREKENRGFRKNIDFGLQNTSQSHSFDENLKWSHGHYGHFAPRGFP